MAEEKKSVPKQSKKPAAPKKEAKKPAAEKHAPKAALKNENKNQLSVGDLVKILDGKEYIFVRPSRKERVVLKEKNSDIEIVVDKNLLTK